MAGQKQDDQLCDDTGCSPEDLTEAMNDREKWRERVRDIRAGDIMIMVMIYRFTFLLIRFIYMCVYVCVCVYQY